MAGSLNKSGDSQSLRSSGRNGPQGDFFSALLGGLPQSIREMLPSGLSQGPQDGESGPPSDPRGTASWKDITFIHAIPGDDNDEGLVILADGSMRKYLSCKGINALLFDEADREQLARNFAALANSC